MFLLFQALVKPKKISKFVFTSLYIYIYISSFSRIIFLSLFLLFYHSGIPFCHSFSLSLTLSCSLSITLFFSPCLSFPLKLCVNFSFPLSRLPSLTQSSSNFSAGIEGLKKKDLARDWMGLSFEISPSQTKSNFL